MKRFFLVLIDIYGRWISPALPGSCRFLPTCSSYASQAIEIHGVFKGTLVAVRRILRCHPLGGSGYDPVPAITAGGGRAGQALGRVLSNSRQGPGDLNPETEH
jgi:putative membrane protein insertion efficiency factor